MKINKLPKCKSFSIFFKENLQRSMKRGILSFYIYLYDENGNMIVDSSIGDSDLFYMKYNKEKNMFEGLFYTATNECIYPADKCFTLSMTRQGFQQFLKRLLLKEIISH